MTYIPIPKNFRDRWFSESFGTEIQESVRRAGKSITLDFSKCEWGDPIPSLALLCHLQQWAEKEKEADLVVDLGLASTLPDGKTTRPRLFLSKHGFLRAMADACPNTTFICESAHPDFPKDFTASALDHLDLAITQSAIQRTLLYGTEPICPPMLLNSGGEANVTADFVNKAIKAMDAKLFSGRASEFPQRDSTLVRVRQVVTEIVSNAVEHAYHEGEPGPIALYARLRRHNDHLGEFETTKRLSNNRSSPKCHIWPILGDLHLRYWSRTFSPRRKLGNAWLQRSQETTEGSARSSREICCPVIARHDLSLPGIPSPKR